MEDNNDNNLLEDINDNLFNGMEIAEDIHLPPQRTPSLSSLRAKDLLRHKLQMTHERNPDKVFNAVYPSIKMMCMDNFNNELQRAKLNQVFEGDSRKQKFQILRAILTSPRFTELIIRESTSLIPIPDHPPLAWPEPTTSWKDHPQLRGYMEEHKNDTAHLDEHSLVDFVRFMRNFIAHSLQCDENYRKNTLGTSRISRKHFSLFFDKAFPQMISLLTWMYVGACDVDDEIIEILGSEEENLDLLYKPDLIEFLLTLTEYFYDRLNITRDQLSTILLQIIKFDDIDSFKEVLIRTKNYKIPKNKKDAQTQTKFQKHNKGTNIPEREPPRFLLPEVPTFSNFPENQLDREPVPQSDSAKGSISPDIHDQLSNLFLPES
ncbi:Oidioi.mRNA.OKI2018_I69.XSR.g14115.t1.cds [Oikopleura dioica]|uniref:Oidioi.mRNA.OKI2018_I69.XSR.g14115.t1.cds n=1 Tax=Oikopleura dioica TaxID=34765 RepID=A0ABN7SHM0_OIKDI|nr:Oidioi.mRNA.OKI2018_I69.XSR.g14115.t1.cds [Oikopleura dioica]